MQYFKIQFTVKNNKPSEEKRTRMEDEKKFSEINLELENYCENLMDECAFACHIQRNEFTFGFISKKHEDVNSFIEKYAKEYGLEIDEIEIEEITFGRFRRMLSDAKRNNYNFDTDAILCRFNISDLDERRAREGGRLYEEIMEKTNKKSVGEAAVKLVTMYESFKPEIERIYAGSKIKKFIGHPVSYMIEASDGNIRFETSKLLSKALCDAGRLENKRFTEVEIDDDYRFPYGYLEALYRSCNGGVITLSIDFDIFEEGNLLTGELDTLETLCELARFYRYKVLTIVSIPNKNSGLKQKIIEMMNGCTFVEIQEKMADYNTSKLYLKKKAKDDGISSDRKLYSKLEAEHGYLVDELNSIYSDWFGNKLKNEIFSQYKDFKIVEYDIAKAKAKGSAYDELNDMIGLESAKKVINQAIDCNKAQKIFADKGLVSDEISRHMIFTGNPGTAKTTVARLFAQIMRDNEILECGYFVEVGRGDLVGKYVGWTAPTIKKKFKEANGGILFIDEAYSLVDDRDGSYGDEAINTIVQEMENRRNDVIVIFAGYPDKMEQFMRKNPGLRSRIAYHVHFDDYTPDELCEIASLIAKKKGVKLDDHAMKKIHLIMEDAVKTEDFGNGRYVRNIIEKAKMAHSSRLIKMDIDSVTKDDIVTITAEDIEIPKQTKKTAKLIGFAG